MKTKVKNLSIRVICIITIILTMFAMLQISNITFAASESADCYVNLTNLTYKINDTEKEITNYTQDQFDEFVSAYTANKLPEIYTTEFLYDGVGMVKTPDLDDFTDAQSNDTKIKTLGIKAINVNMTGNIEFTGTITG